MFHFKKNSLPQNNLTLKGEIVQKNLFFPIKLFKTGFVAMTNGDKHLVLTYYSISGCCIGSRIIAHQLHICNLDTPTKYLKIFVSNTIRVSC